LRERCCPGAGERPFEVEDVHGHVVDPISHGRRRDGAVLIVSGEDGAWVGESAVLLVTRATLGGEEAGEPPRGVCREAVSERCLAKTLLKRAWCRRDLERESRRQLTALELDVEHRGELLE
jgi:hypothetical protein